ncbi:hypothetical protein [Ureibacillus acetophenoni]|uniref:Uncharacterized protein n=1 Tax=Ureibacillus acetophenoni TaxID=614649 RepID=A0A285URG1_9BACL|nr:hypothetical protein [Ureibacillus acetophenoni]SOC44422.1 hypothetical protein SAMN05877842_12015 [Ureibacillus acetophenoni]
MYSLHDNEIISYEVNLKKEEIIMHTVSHWEGAPDVTVKFSGVLAHWFEHILRGSIILDLERRELDEFLNYNKELLQKNKNYWWPVDYKDLEDLKNILINGQYSYYVISASLGLNGWILAKKIEFNDGR